MQERAQLVGRSPLALEDWEYASHEEGPFTPLARWGPVAAQGQTGDLDAKDWWYRARVPTRPVIAKARAYLHLDGLATLADVWVNDVHVLRSENAFLHHAIDVTEHLRGDDTVKVRFQSLTTALAVKRPRPRWKTRLVTHQTLRFFRTPLLGRMPGWCPPIAPAGPVGKIWIEDSDVRLPPVAVRATLDGKDGIVELEGGGIVVKHVVRDVERWWPHTHGAQPRYDVRVPFSVDGRACEIEVRGVGFRTVTVDRGGDGFALSVNGEPLFCRGAAWMPLDLTTLRSSPEAYRSALLTVRRGGFNMVRLSGTTAYEDDAFYDLCDELGVLVWQDFMFANMDYPISDEVWLQSARAEIAQVCSGLQARPSLAVLCGGSEVEQQAAMLGLPREEWSSALFAVEIPRLIATHLEGTPYASSSPTGGALPIHVSSGVGHYYGVGAYLRDFDDARRAEVRFASECLAFSNLPGAGADDRVGVPRDVGASWDFADVRDHYIGRLFRVDVAKLRATDSARYLTLGRVTTGEVMARTIAEWRRVGSITRGALVWTLRDLEPGAGWGVVESSGREKPAYYALKRACAPLVLFLTDEGVNGLDAHLINEGASSVEGLLHVTLYRDGALPIVTASRAVAIPRRGSIRESIDGIIGYFTDVAYAYRFGPPGHDAVVARFVDAEGTTLASAFHFPVGVPNVVRTLELDAHCSIEKNTARVTLTAKQLAFAVAVSANCEGTLSDNYFHLEPGRPYSIRFEGNTALADDFALVAAPLNADRQFPFRCTQ